MALKLSRATWVRFSQPPTGMSNRVVQTDHCTVLVVHVESRQAFYATTLQPNVRSSPCEEWQLAEGEFEKLAGFVCGVCGETFENQQAIGSHRSTVHGNKGQKKVSVG